MDFADRIRAGSKCSTGDDNPPPSPAPVIRVVHGRIAPQRVVQPSRMRMTVLPSHGACVGELIFKSGTAELGEAGRALHEPQVVTLASGSGVGHSLFAVTRSLPSWIPPADPGPGGT